MPPVEFSANLINTISILLANRRSVHTWWTGIVASVLFVWVFVGAKLYADALLQGFFIASGILGWVQWARAGEAPPTLVTHADRGRLLVQVGIGLAVTLAYAWGLATYTDAAAPLPDAAVLTTSVLGQLLLVDKRVESWYFWLLANTISVPLYLSRGLYVTAALYCIYWVNAVIALKRWRELARTPQTVEVVNAKA
ncbi:MAG TPA: nicotinamide riboside transporter PnuC [Polyangiaceae bacterium]|jgi:nicotinamide mononucleotide transporter|nr:nicotinamide riboside transporter PnuC [Polyangiaceae bacterium]